MQQLLQQHEKLVAMEVLLRRLYMDYTVWHAIYTQAAHARTACGLKDVDPSFILLVVEVSRLTILTNATNSL